MLPQMVSIRTKEWLRGFFVLGLAIRETGFSGS